MVVAWLRSSQMFTACEGFGFDLVAINISPLRGEEQLPTANEDLFKAS